ncbi:ZP domain-containing protein [Aphelenchoides besseyi]|nr:ZP domain-containing protein [Aphelenchoides besseyi]
MKLGILIFFILRVAGYRLLEDREVVCSSDRMLVNLSFGRPFSGVVFGEGEFSNPECKWKGNGGHYLLVVVPLNSTGGFCGLRFNEKTGKHSIRLIVSPDAMILTDESMALAAHCVQTMEDITLTLSPPSFDSSIKVMRTESLTVAGSATASPELGLRLLSDHGLLGSIVNEGMVGKRLTLDVQLKDTSIFDMFVHDCIAHDGTRSEDASVNIVDSNGCAVKLSRAVDEPVFTTPPHQQNTSKHVYVYIYGFQFTSSDFVHFECKVTTCVNVCPQKQCQPPSKPMTKLAAAHPLEIYTIKSMLQIVPQNANSRSSFLLSGSVNSFVSAQAMQRSNSTECLEASTAGIVVLAALAIFICLSYFTRKLIFSYHKFLTQECS